jgi:polyhydroxybutyrate depolymerase
VIRGVLRRTARWQPGSRPVVLWVAVAMTVISVASCSVGRSAAPLNEGGHKVDPSPGCERRAPRDSVPAGREQTRTLDAGPVRGSYELAVARTYRSQRPAPLVLLFYGFDSGPAQFSSLTGLPSRGSRQGYLVAAPHTQGAESEWQFNAHGADARFVDGLVASLEHAYCIDTNSIFAVGFSAGAAFTIIYSCAREDRIAAIATVAVEYQLGCTRPMSILAFHGTEDPLVPYQNGAIGLSLPGVKVRGTGLNMGDWARLDRCRVTPRQTRPGSQVIRQEWSGCARKTSVVLYTIVGGGHSWPGANPKLAVGLTTQQVSATSQILSFFDSVRR